MTDENPEDLEPAGATWRHAINRATKGDASQLALLLTHARVPPRLADEIYGLVLAAPWRDRRRGTQPGLSDAEKVAMQAHFVTQHLVSRRPRDEVLAELGRMYRHRAMNAGQDLGRAVIERALAENRALRAKGTGAKAASPKASTRLRARYGILSTLDQ
jgi:hypothetical protein